MREKERGYLGISSLVLIKLQLEIKYVNHSAWKEFLLSGLVMQSTERCVGIINQVSGRSRCHCFSHYPHGAGGRGCFARPGSQMRIK